ncbi:MAG: ATP-dependent DNA helicase UvrD2 [Acidimicrobiia bacterium]
MRADELLTGLDPTQRAAVTEPVVPLAILAPAGSGKTRALTRRIAWQAAVGNLDPNHVLAVTFTRKAAGELRGRLARLGVRGAVTAGTFHAVALAQLRRRHADAGTAMPGLLDRKARMLGPLLGDQARGAELAVTINEVASEIEWAKARRIRPDRYAAQVAQALRETPRAPKEIATIYAAYEREKKRKGLLDFDDLIAACTEALETDPTFAATQRWRFRHLFVDEFQDVTLAQLSLLRAWLGTNTDLCVVGDPDQAIYAFAGADAGLLTRFGDHFEGAAVVRLGANYRSTPEIVNAARAVLPAHERAEVRAAAAEGPTPTVTAYPTDTAEARGIADELIKRHGSMRPWSSMAVLYRVNAQSAPFEEALSRAGVPHRVRGAAAFLDRPEVKAVIDELRRGAKTAPGRAFAEHLTDLVTDAAELSEERREHVDAVAALGREYLAAEGSTGSVAGFLEYLRASLRGGDDGGLRDDAVDLLTFHRAKGLEWDTVFVTGLERGLVPISHAAGKPEATDEERRLLYVALSRAERHLHLSWAKERARGTRVSARTKSPYLREIEHAIGDSPVPVPDEGAAALGAAGARQRLAALDHGELPMSDRPLSEALVAWRRELARAAAVPAYVILDNKTLRNVASTRPRSTDALLALPGIGPVKLERYGAALLEVVGQHSG